jgi:hypothetical protein
VLPSHLKVLLFSLSLVKFIKYLSQKANCNLLKVGNCRKENIKKISLNPCSWKKDFCFVNLVATGSYQEKQLLQIHATSESEAVLSFFPRGGRLRSGQLFVGGEQVSVAELEGRVHLLHIRELPPQIVACPLTVLLTVCGLRG